MLAHSSSNGKAPLSFDDRYVNAHLAWPLGAHGRLLPPFERWQSIGLFVNHTLKQDSCGAFPITCSLLEGRKELQVENFRLPARNESETKKVTEPVLMAHFYRLMPGTWLRPHFGTHSRLVASLGLTPRFPGAPGGGAGGIVSYPLSQASLRVADETRTWTRGQAIIFDDAFIHSVEFPMPNNSNLTLPRFVLAISFLHPDVLMASP